MTHIETVTPRIYEGAETGEITAEIRKIKAPIREGDTLIYQERNEKSQKFTGREIDLKITTVKEKGPGLRPGFALVLFKRSKKPINLTIGRADFPTLEQNQMEADNYVTTD